MHLAAATKREAIAIPIANVMVDGAAGLLYLMVFYLPSLYAARATHPQYSDPLSLLPTLLFGTVGYGVLVGIVAGLIAAGAVLLLRNALRGVSRVIVAVTLANVAVVLLAFVLFEFSRTGLSIWVAVGLAVAASIATVVLTLCFLRKRD